MRAGNEDREQDSGLYRGGHLDTSIEAFSIFVNTPELITGWLPVGEGPTGPLLAVVHNGPGSGRYGGPHHHETTQVRVFLRGTTKIGRHTYGPGDVRIQRPGVVYGPETHGENGATQLLYFADRRAMYPHYRDRDADAFAAVMRRTGIEPR